MIYDDLQRIIINHFKQYYIFENVLFNSEYKIDNEYDITMLQGHININFEHIIFERLLQIHKTFEAKIIFEVNVPTNFEEKNCKNLSVRIAENIFDIEYLDIQNVRLENVKLVKHKNVFSQIVICVLRGKVNLMKEDE